MGMFNVEDEDGRVGIGAAPNSEKKNEGALVLTDR